jgi:hypothetical protein
MSNFTLSTIITILQHLTYAVVFLLCAGAAYATITQQRVQQWLGDASALVKVVLFLALSALLYQAISPIVSDFYAFPRGLINSTSTAGFTSSAQCLSGVLVLLGLAFGSWRLAAQSRSPNRRR